MLVGQSLRRLLRLFVAISGVAFTTVILPKSVQALACPGSLTGGTVTAVGDDCVLQFTTVGSYTWTPPAGITTVDVLVVGGGGGGGADAAGGGGAGGYIYQQGFAVSGSTAINVGSGGVGGTNSTATTASNGSNSVFGSLTAIGGGRGGTYNGGAGASGGSGGGGGFVSGTAGNGTNSQGNVGGAGGNLWGGGPAAGGGGGAGGAGTFGNTSDGNGGPGLSNSITGSARWYAAGGGGGRWSVTTNIENGGSGIGGRGAGSCGANPSMPGTANTGSGGGGAPAGCQTYGSAGGSGIVIVRYSLPDVVAPTFVSAALNSSGITLTLTMNEALSATTATANAFTVVADGQQVSVSAVTVSGSTVRLTMSPAVWSGASVTVAYADPSNSNDPNAVQDLAGNDAASISATSVTNSSTVTTTTTTTTTTIAPTTTAPASLVIDLRTSTTVVAQGQGSVATIASTVARTKSTVAAVVTSPPTSTLPLVTTTAVPSPGNVTTGAAAVQVGGKSSPASVSRENNVVVVKVADARAQFAGVDEKGNVTPLDNAGNIGLKPGSRVRIRADGFQVGSIVEAWLFSSPTKMGETEVDEEGAVDATFTIPKDAPIGSHRIAVVAKLMNGKDATFTLGIAVTEFKKGKNVTPWIIGIPLALAMLSGLFLPPALRRRRQGDVSPQ